MRIVTGVSAPLSPGLYLEEASLELAELVGGLGGGTVDATAIQVSRPKVHLLPGGKYLVIEFF